jgi:hypothetical protein
MSKYMSEGSPEYQEAERLKRIAVKVEERRKWRELRDTYERCVLIAKQVWSAELTEAEIEQKILAEQMRDRLPCAGAVIPGQNAEIPTPLFTPRDRLQFLKEVATTLLISADRRNLPASPEPKEGGDLRESPSQAIVSNAPLAEEPTTEEIQGVT